MADPGRPSNALADATSRFNGERLTMARQLAGLKKSALAAKIDMSPASVTGWEAGTKFPNRGTVAKLALALGVAPEFFGGGAPTRVTAPHFRSLRSTPQVAQDEAKAYARFAAEIVGLLDKAVEFPELLLPDLTVDADDPSAPEASAREARAFFGAAPGPIQHVVRLVERAGVAVVYSEPRIASIDAYSLHSGTRPIIILNPAKDDYYRQRFDVAHELGHLVMHHDSDPGSKALEDQANRFAAEFLMPADGIRSALPASTAGHGWNRLNDLKEHWGVSLAALLYRARTLGVMSDVSYRNAMIRMSENGWRRAEPGRVSTLEMPSMLPRARESLNDAGIYDEAFLSGAGLPVSLYRTVVSRTPRGEPDVFD
ncbi:ImmA/IrrE family metallo-endopeptidase [Glaciihabitans arcticus]|uniref:ImmA/IrrE family metallo-endopeptidase n=2 Tax=Glaciihabitans arcticus TaxID=2668039 RepID=A0A4Q9GV08_9MICO|nr:XRE family transcriptional regulator [Glaciihabitans arcticus]TBN57458.1 ImmA/IrrE family metallo-endopeptidase [Glaciihabitans arcticus]